MLLKEKYPELGKEFIGGVHKQVKFDELTIGSHELILWKCPKGNDHIWQTMAKERARGRGCPYCVGQKVVKSTSLASKYPKVAKEWDYKRNYPLTPEQVPPRHSKKVYWICSKDNHHKWYATPHNRTLHKSSCPYCSNKKVCHSNCLATTNPVIASQWYYEKNGDLTPEKVTAGSQKKVYWKCPEEEDHIWKTSVKDRKNGRGCPCCAGKKLVKSNSLDVVYPAIAKEWDFEKNYPLTPKDVYCQSNTKFWWKCSKGEDHNWRTSVRQRALGSGCTVCLGRKVVKSNCLATTHPGIAAQWFQADEKNLTPEKVTAGSHKYVYWKCSKADDHIWKATVLNRTSGWGCPCCSGQKVVKSNCLVTTHPKLVKEWHFEKNGILYPDMYTAGSRNKVWWKCPEGNDHEWYASIGHRSRGVGCPICAGQLVVKSNCLATTHQDLIKEWDYGKNKPLTPENVTSGSKKKVYWICNKDTEHKWKTSILTRALQGCGCPICAKQTNISETKMYEIIKEIFKGLESIRGYRPKWLNKMELDVYIPSYNIGFEYQGIQHFKPKEYFGGKIAYKEQLKRDKIKKSICAKRGVKLIYINYEEDLSEKLIIQKIRDIGVVVNGY